MLIKLKALWTEYLQWYLLAVIAGVVTGIWWIVDRSAWACKAVAVYLIGRVKHYSGFIGWLILTGVVLAGGMWIGTKLNSAMHRAEIEVIIDPAMLKADNDRGRRQWANSCINNAAAGVLGGATMSAEAIGACSRASFEQFPEKNWAEIAESYRQKYIQKGDL